MTKMLQMTLKRVNIVLVGLVNPSDIRSFGHWASQYIKKYFVAKVKIMIYQTLFSL